MEKQKEPKIPYETDVFHIFGAKKFDTNAFWERVSKRLEEMGYAPNILIYTSDPTDGFLIHYDVFLKGESSQGIQLHQMDDFSLHLELPWLASWGDADLAFAIMRALDEKYTYLEVYLNNDTEEPIALVDENLEALMSKRAENMAAMLEFNFENDTALGAPGAHREYILDSLDPKATDEEWQKAVADAFQNFVAIQWLFEDCVTAGLANVKSPEGEEFQMRILTNSADTFVPCCQKLSLSASDNSLVKLVNIADFCEAMEGSEYFIAVDRMQFVLREMPKKEWDKMVKEIKGLEFAK